MKTFLRLSIFLLAYSVEEISAQTIVSGGIYANETWTQANSPYIVQDTLILFQGDTLTIEKGVTVEFNDGVFFDSRGVINAYGTVDDSIIFTSSSASPHQGSWKSINIWSNYGGLVNMRYCRFSYAEDALYTYFSSHPTIKSFVTHCLFINNKHALNGYVSDNPFMNVDSSAFINNEHAVSQYVNISTTLRHCYIHGNTFGIYYSDSPNVDSCVFCGNLIAISSNGINCSNTIITNNRVGIVETGTQKYYLRNAIIAENDTGLVLHYGIFSIDSFKDLSICNNHLFNIVHRGSYNLDLSDLCWCDTDQAAISDLIYDGYDNPAFGLINFVPFSTCSIQVGSCPSYVGIPTPSVNAQAHMSSIFPNPFNSITSIQFHLREPSKATIEIFEINGKLLEVLLDGELLSKGDHSINFDAEKLPSGIYYYLIRSGDQLEKGKMVLMR